MNSFVAMLNACAGVSSATAEPDDEGRYHIVYSDEIGQVRLAVMPPPAVWELPRMWVAEDDVEVDRSGPHVMQSHELCYKVVDEEFRIDHRQPARVLEWAIKKAVDVARDAGRGGEWARDEFLSEASAYWGSSDRGGHPAGILWKGTTPQAHDRFKMVERDGIVYANEATQWVKGAASTYGHSVVVADPTVFVARVLRPTRRDSTALHHLPDALDKSGQRLLENVRKSGVGTCVVLAVPRPSSETVLLGLYVTHEGFKPIHVELINDDITRTRGGARSLDREVVLVGCGSVGGHVAGELARAGFKRITLIDPDHLSMANMYRHSRGGPAFFGHNKAHLFELELQCQYPNTTVHAIQSRVEPLAEDLMRDKPSALWLACTGNPTTHSWLTACASNHENIDLVLGWVEPLGLGGHVLATAPGRLHGCYDCLFPADKDPPGNAAALVAPGQTFTKRVAGCAQTFTPFGSIDAFEVAGEMVRIATRLTVEGLHNSELVSWRRNTHVAHSQGITLSHRLDGEPDGQRRFEMGPTFCPKRHACPSCGGLR